MRTICYLTYDNNNNFKFIKMNEFLKVYILFFLPMWETDPRLGYQCLAYLLHIISLYTSLLFEMSHYNPLDCSEEHVKYKSFMFIPTIVLIPSRF
jgi:uncharacterized membrane protein